MKTKTKNCIRTVVICGIVAWPAVESYRLWDTTQQMEQALALERSVNAKVAAAKAKSVDVANATARTPASAAGSSQNK